MKILIILSMFLLARTSFYELEITSVDGDPVLMKQYRGKKILLVNIATSSKRANQLSALQELQNQSGDSLVIIGFPSNSFGNEPKTNSEIKQFCYNTYGVKFLLASKNSVSSNEPQSIYAWLANIGENEMVEGKVIGDFQKFLINEEGKLIGVFAPSIDPLNRVIQNALTGN